MKGELIHTRPAGKSMKFMSTEEVERKKEGFERKRVKTDQEKDERVVSLHNFKSKN